MQVPNAWRLDMHEVGDLFFQLVDQKGMLNRYMEIVRNNTNLSQQVRQRNPWLDLGPRTWYAYYACLLLRNIGDEDTRTVSFHNLLTKMAAAKYLPYIVFSGGATLTKHKLYTDRRLIKNTIKPIKRFADQVIAHKERGWSRIVPPTFNQVETCISGLHPVLVQYMELLNGPGASVRPGLGPGWDSIFTYAWA